MSFGRNLTPFSVSVQGSLQNKQKLVWKCAPPMLVHRRLLMNISRRQMTEHYRNRDGFDKLNLSILRSRNGVVVRAFAPHPGLPPKWPGFDSPTRRHMWVEFVVGSRPCFERLFSGYSGFPLTSKTNISKFQLNLEYEGHRFVSRRTVKCHPP